MGLPVLSVRFSRKETIKFLNLPELSNQQIQVLYLFGL